MISDPFFSFFFWVARKTVFSLGWKRNWFAWASRSPKWHQRRKEMGKACMKASFRVCLFFFRGHGRKDKTPKSGENTRKNCIESSTVNYTKEVVLRIIKLPEQATICCAVWDMLRWRTFENNCTIRSRFARSSANFQWRLHEINLIAVFFLSC